MHLCKWHVSTNSDAAPFSQLLAEKCGVAEFVDEFSLLRWRHTVEDCLGAGTFHIHRHNTDVVSGAVA